MGLGPIAVSGEQSEMNTIQCNQKPWQPGSVDFQRKGGFAGRQRRSCPADLDHFIMIPFASASASASVKVPFIKARPPVISSMILGADSTCPSTITATLSPM